MIAVKSSEAWAIVRKGEGRGALGMEAKRNMDRGGISPVGSRMAFVLLYMLCIICSTGC